MVPVMLMLIELPAVNTGLFLDRKPLFHRRCSLLSRCFHLLLLY